MHARLESIHQVHHWTSKSVPLRCLNAQELAPFHARMVHGRSGRHGLYFALLQVVSFHDRRKCDDLRHDWATVGGFKRSVTTRLLPHPVSVPHVLHIYIYIYDRARDDSTLACFFLSYEKSNENRNLVRSFLIYYFLNGSVYNLVSLFLSSIAHASFVFPPTNPSSSFCSMAGMCNSSEAGGGIAVLPLSFPASATSCLRSASAAEVDAPGHHKE